MKSKKKKPNITKTKKILFILFCVVLVFLITFGIYKLIINNKFFNVIDRTKNIEKYQKNEDYTIVGWIRIQGTNIDYPVLFYDNAPISDVKQDIAWTYRNVKKLDDRTIIEGHNILNLSSKPLIADKNSKRFEQLLSFYDPIFVKNNKYIEYSMNGENYVFKIFAVSFSKSEVNYTKYKYEKEEMQDYIEAAIADSLYKFDVKVDASDKIISLYTCTRFYGYSESVSFRIDARLLRDNEKIKNYEVTKTVNYETAKKYSDSVSKNSKEVKS